MTLVRATRAATSPVIGHYQAVQIHETDWDTGDTVATHTVYKAFLADGTPAGAPTTWGDYIKPNTNTYPTETAARAAIRKAHRHLTAIGRDLQTIRDEHAARPDHTTATTTVRDSQGHAIGAVHHRTDGTHTAALLAAHGLGYMPLEVCDTAAEAEHAVRNHLAGARP